MELTTEQKQLKYYCLDKAVEVYKYSQQIAVLELAKQFEQYLLNSISNINSH